MNIYFAYTAGTPDHIYYGKYFGYSGTHITEMDLLAAIFPSLTKCYAPLSSMNDFTLSILSTDFTSVFSNRDPLKYKFVTVAGSPTQLYFNGTLMN